VRPRSDSGEKWAYPGRKCELNAVPTSLADPGLQTRGLLARLRTAREIVSSDFVEDRGSSCGYAGEARVEPYSHVPKGDIKVVDTPVTPFELFAIRSTPCIWRTSDSRLRILIEPTSERHE
jgi:hypothetical protein